MHHARTRPGIERSRSSLRSRALTFAFLATALLGLALPAREALNATRSVRATAPAQVGVIASKTDARTEIPFDEFRLNELQLKYFGQQIGF